MAPSKRLKPLVRLAESREQAAARGLGDAQGRLAELEQQLAELVGYREEYRQRSGSLGAGGIGARQLQDMQQFLGQLNTAVAQVEAQIVNARADVERARQGWLSRHTRSEALGKVVARNVARETKAADKREQGESDDRSQRRPIR